MVSILIMLPRLKSFFVLLSLTFISVRCEWKCSPKHLKQTGDNTLLALLWFNTTAIKDSGGMVRYLISLVEFVTHCASVSLVRLITFSPSHVQLRVYTASQAHLLDSLLVATDLLERQ